MARSNGRSERVICCAHDGTRIYRPGYRPPCCARYSTGAVWIACPCSTNAACSRTMSGACTCNSIVSRVACRCGGVTYGATGGRAPHFLEPPIHRSSRLSSSRQRVNHRGAWSRRWTAPGTVDSSTRRIWGRSSVRSRAASGACGTSWIHRQSRDPRRWCGSCSAVSGCGGERRCRFRTWVESTSSWRGGSSSSATARPITRPGRLSVRTVVAIAPPQRRVTSPSASSRRRSCTSRRLFARRSRGSSRDFDADAAAADRAALLRPHAIPASRAQVSTYSASAGSEVVRRPRLRAERAKGHTDEACARSRCPHNSCNSGPAWLGACVAGRSAGVVLKPGRPADARPRASDVGRAPERRSFDAQNSCNPVQEAGGGVRGAPNCRSCARDTRYSARSSCPAWSAERRRPPPLGGAGRASNGSDQPRRSSPMRS